MDVVAQLNEVARLDVVAQLDRDVWLVIVAWQDGAVRLIVVVQLNVLWQCSSPLPRGWM